MRKQRHTQVTAVFLPPRFTDASFLTAFLLSGVSGPKLPSVVLCPRPCDAPGGSRSRPGLNWFLLPRRRTMLTLLTLLTLLTSLALRTIPTLRHTAYGCSDGVGRATEKVVLVLVSHPHPRPRLPYPLCLSGCCLAWPESNRHRGGREGLRPKDL